MNHVEVLMKLREQYARESSDSMLSQSDRMESLHSFCAIQYAIDALSAKPDGEAVGETWSKHIPEDWGRHPSGTEYRIKFYGDPLPDGTKIYTHPPRSREVVVDDAALEALDGAVVSMNKNGKPVSLHWIGFTAEDRAVVLRTAIVSIQP